MPADGPDPLWQLLHLVATQGAMVWEKVTCDVSQVLIPNSVSALWFWHDEKYIIPIDTQRKSPRKVLRIM